MNKEEIIELDENDVQHLFDAGVNMAGEIKELENQIEHYRSTNIHLIDKNKYLQQENKKYKEVIDKAINNCNNTLNYINNTILKNNIKVELNELLKIKGGLDTILESLVEEVE